MARLPRTTARKIPVATLVRNIGDRGRRALLDQARCRSRYAKQQDEIDVLLKGLRSALVHSEPRPCDITAADCGALARVAEHLALATELLEEGTRA